MKNNQLVLKEIDLDDLNKDSELVKYYDGDVAIIDDIRDLKSLAPIYAKMNFLTICVNGRIQFDINDRQVRLGKDEIMLSASSVILDNYLLSPDFECKMLCLSDDIIHAMLGDQIYLWNMSVYNHHTCIKKLPEEDREQFVHYYELIKFKMQHRANPNSNNSMQSIIQAMLLDVVGLLSSWTQEARIEVKKTHGKAVFNDFLQILNDTEVKHHPVDYYARQLNITPKYLTMLCTKYSGKPASEWITQYTKEDIRHALCYTTLSIKEISQSLGFVNASFFGSYVRRNFGMSPSRLRAQKG